MISETELDALVQHIASLEAKVADQAAHIDNLTRLHILHTEGAGALLKQFKGVALTEPCPPGYGRGAAGQLVMTDREMIYDLLRAQRNGEY